MSKVKNRFLPHQFITVHDELLSSLYNLSPENMQYRVINGEKYIVNSVKSNHFEIGLRVKIDDNTLPSTITDGDYITSYYTNPLNYDIDDFSYNLFGNMLDTYYKYVCFTNMEKYLTNILLEKFLSSNQELDMTLLEIEHKYRAKASYRSVSLSKSVAERYAKTLDSLSKKELFLITDDKFRDYRYGVRNKTIYQKFLTIRNPHKYGLNNINFSYSFGGFGLIIKLSKRYSTIMPAGYYRIAFNEVRWHLVAFYLSRQIFIQNGLVNKYPNIRHYSMFTVDIEQLMRLTTDLRKPTDLKKPIRNYLRDKRRIVEIIDGYLEYNESISKYHINYDYLETERFVLKHQFDYDIKTGLDNYKFGVKDLDQDVNVKIEVELHDPLLM